MDIGPSETRPGISERNAIVRHALLSASFVVLFLLLNRPEVLVVSRLGSIVWYPATGFAVAFMLTISPWYGLLGSFSAALAGILIYNQPLLTWSGTVGAAAFGVSFATAAYALRGPLQIDLGLRQQQDVVRYISLTTIASLGSTLVGTACMALEHSISWSDYWSSAAVQISLIAESPVLFAPAQT